VNYNYETITTENVLEVGLGLIVGGALRKLSAVTLAISF
jgi:hypothetical protein